MKTYYPSFACDHCEGDYEIMDIEPPDRSVGIMGYAVFMNNESFETHEPECPIRTMDTQGKEWEQIEVKLGWRYQDYLNEPPF